MTFFYVLFIVISGWLGLIAESRATDNDLDRVIAEVESLITITASSLYDGISDQIQGLRANTITSEQYYQAGEKCRQNASSHGQTAIRCYREAAISNPPHVDACLRCGEYYAKKNSDDDLHNALYFYKRSLEVAPELQQAHKALMKLYYDNMRKNEEQREANLKRAREHAEQVTDRDSEDERIFSNITYELLCCTKSEEEAFIDALQRQKERLQKRLTNLQTSNKAVFVLGPTGAGKSTLVNLLSGIPLEGKKDKYGRLTLDVSTINRIDNGSHIGRGTKTGTNFPISFCINDIYHSPIIFWDCPGFGDVGGARPDIIHMTALIEALKSFDQVKVLLVLDEGRLTIPRSSEIIDMINECVGLFDKAQLLNMVSLIVTGTTGINHSLILHDYAEDQDNKLTVDTRNFLNTFLQHNPPRVWNMPKPTEEGTYNVSVDDCWQTIQKSDYVEKPFLKAKFSNDSISFLKRLFGHLNKQISDELKKEDKLIIGEIAKEIFEVERSSDALRQTVRAFLSLIEHIGSPVHTGDMSSRFNVPHLNRINLTTIKERLDHIDTLQRLFGAIKNGEDEALSVTFDPITWREGLKLVEQNLNDLWNCLQRPTSVTKTPRTETFNTPEADGFVREEERFDLPPNDFWGERRDIVTFQDFYARRSLVYTHDRANRQSTAKEIYTIHRIGGEESMDGGSWTKPYALTDISTEVAIPDTLNFIIHKTYKRADNTPDAISYRIFENDVQTESQSKKRYQHHDNNRFSYEHMRCFMYHEGDNVDFGCYLDRIHHHTYELRNKRIINHSSIDLINERVSLKIERTYQRVDQTSYLENNEVHNVPIVLGSKNDVYENDRVVRRLRYNVRYENMRTDLPEQIRYYPLHRYGEELDSPHARIPLTAENRITKIEVSYSGYVDWIRFYTESQLEIATHKVGGNNSYNHTIIEFDDDELLTGVFGKKGSFVDAIGFITNKRRHGPFGGGGGSSFNQNLGRISNVGVSAGWFRRHHVFGIPTENDFIICNIEIN